MTTRQVKAVAEAIEKYMDDFMLEQGQLKNAAQAAIAEIESVLDAELGTWLWEIEPHPYDSSFDVFVTNDDDEATAFWQAWADAVATLSAYLAAGGSLEETP